LPAALKEQDCTRMPPAVRTRIEIDWLAVVLTAAKCVSDVILFPLLGQQTLG
jgi:lysyl-tRNA synthetase class II